GNHGIEPSYWMAEAAAAVASWAPAVAEGVAGMEGVRVENKRHSLAVHYRHAPSQSGAYRAIRDAVDRLPADARIMDGHKVVNVVPAGAPNKGDALKQVAAEASLDAILFVGDDVTDEDAFAVLTRGDSLGVRVCPSATSHAEWYIPSQPDIDRLLSALVQARP
ncbi:MAG: trehalose-phosphatase, partial [Gemmatimonadaceae bacterium]